MIAETIRGEWARPDEVVESTRSRGELWDKFLKTKPGSEQAAKVMAEIRSKRR